MEIITKRWCKQQEILRRMVTPSGSHVRQDRAAHGRPKGQGRKACPGLYEAAEKSMPSKECRVIT